MCRPPRCSGLERAPLDVPPAACDLYEKAVSLGVMSKAFGLVRSIVVPFFARWAASAFLMR